MIKINRIRKAIQNNHNLQKTDAKKEAETSDLITKSAKVLCKDASRSDLPLDLSKNLPSDLARHLAPHLAKQLSQNLNNVLLALHNENRNLERHRLSVLLHRETSFRASSCENRKECGD